MDWNECLFRGLLSTLGRIAFEESTVYDLVDPTGKGGKQLTAFNMADGQFTQAEIARRAKIDSANLSKLVSRWIDAGVMFRLGDGRDATLLHLFPVSKPRAKRK